MLYLGAVMMSHTLLIEEMVNANSEITGSSALQVRAPQRMTCIIISWINS
jgi:hypothetical protein